MVTNTFQHTTTNEIIEKTFNSIAEQTIWKQENPEYSVIFVTPNRIGDPFHLGFQKVPDDFRTRILDPMKRHWAPATSHDGHTKVGKIESRTGRGAKEI